MMQLKFGPTKYEYRHVARHVVDPDNDNTIGRVRYQKGEIQVLDDMTPDLKLVTTWHEVFHIIAGQRNLVLTEDMIDALAFGVIDALQENPVLFHMLFGEDHEAPLPLPQLP